MSGTHDEPQEYHGTTDLGGETVHVYSQRVNVPDVIEVPHGVQMRVALRSLIDQYVTARDQGQTAELRGNYGFAIEAFGCASGTALAALHLEDGDEAKKMWGERAHYCTTEARRVAALLQKKPVRRVSK